jgi:acyl-CoA thioesterase YciA
MELITTRVCMASQIGVHGNLFGGEMLSVLDESGAVYTCQICDTPRMVTKKIEEVIFQRPVKTGNLIKIYGEVEKIGNTSITINLEARKHNVYTGVQDLVCSTKMVFVRIDDEGAPVPISERVKKRYDDRVKLFGRGLLTPEEMIIERGKKKKEDK